MAPTKVKSGSSKGSNKRQTKPSSRASTSKHKNQSSPRKAMSKPQSKPKTTVKPSKRHARKVYTEEELSIPKLNMITPAGVHKFKGKKMGKVFVDDQKSMMTILAMVNAEKEGQIESKMMRARQMEEIRQARQQEMDARAEQKKANLDETKKSLRKRKRKPQANAKIEPGSAQLKKPKKSVSWKPQAEVIL